MSSQSHSHSPDNILQTGTTCLQKGLDSFAHISPHLSPTALLRSRLDPPNLQLAAPKSPHRDKRQQSFIDHTPHHTTPHHTTHTIPHHTTHHLRGGPRVDRRKAWRAKQVGCAPISEPVRYRDTRDTSPGRSIHASVHRIIGSFPTCWSSWHCIRYIFLLLGPHLIAKLLTAHSVG